MLILILGISILGLIIFQKSVILKNFGAEISDLKFQILALKIEVLNQRKLLTVYSESTSEQALMSHVLTMMRKNRIGVETLIVPDLA